MNEEKITTRTCEKCLGTGNIILDGNNSILVNNVGKYNLWNNENYSINICDECYGKGYIDIMGKLYLENREEDYLY